MYTKLFFWLSFAIVFSNTVLAQVKIGGVPGAPVSSAVLELDGSEKRALHLPLVNSNDQLSYLPIPVNGLVIMPYEVSATPDPG